MACLFERDDAGQLVHRRLGGAVGRPSLVRLRRRARRDVDQHARVPGRSRTCAAKTDDPLATPVTLTSIVWATSAPSASASGAMGPSRPALLTQRSMRPNRATTASAKPASAARSVTSTAESTGVSDETMCPSCAVGLVRTTRRGRCRAHKPRCMPDAAKCTANPAPSPRLAPVTTATRPVTFGFMRSGAPRVLPVAPSPPGPARRTDADPLALRGAIARRGRSVRFGARPPRSRHRRCEAVGTSPCPRSRMA